MGVLAGIVLQSTILVIVILVLRRMLGEQLHVYIRYGLWLLVALRLVIPVNFIDSPVSALRLENALAAGVSEWAFDALGTEELPSDDMLVENGPENGWEIGNSIDEYQFSPEKQPEQRAANNRLKKMRERQVLAGSGEGADVVSTDQAQIGRDSVEKKIKEQQAIGFYGTAESFAQILRGVWLIGSVMVGGGFLIGQLHFRRRLCRTRRICQESWSKRLDGKAQTECRLPVYCVNGLESPCLVGLLKPAIYVASGLETDSDYYRYIVTHEKVHYLHGDPVWTFLRVVLVSVYWFHPFVWIAAAASARDGELACDYGTVRRLGEEEKLRYGEMLLVFSGSGHGKRIYFYGTMLWSGKSEIKERILRLTEENGSKTRAGILTVLLMFVLAGCAFTGAKQGIEPEEGITAGEEIQRTEGRTVVEDSVDQSMTDGDDDQGISDEERGLREPRQFTAAEAVISGETKLGVDGPTLDYAGQMDVDGESHSVIIFHDYFGLIIYDLTDRKILHSLDLSVIGCNFTQGDNACQVAVSEDGTKVWLHPRSKSYLFRYEVEEEKLWQVPLVKNFWIDLEAEDLFDRYLATEEQYVGWRSNYLYEEYMDEKGLQTAYIYLYASSSEDVAKFRNLQCVWDDMVFILWD